MQKNLGITLVANMRQAGTSLQGCKALVKGQQGTNPPGALAGGATLPADALYRREQVPNLCCRLSAGTDASGASPAPAAQRLVAPFLKVTGEVCGGDKNRSRYLVTWWLCHQPKALGDTTTLSACQPSQPPPWGMNMIKADLGKMLNC